MKKEQHISIPKTMFLMLLIGFSVFGFCQSQPDSTKKPLPITHVFWARGKQHPKELKLGHYVVVAQATSEEDSKKLIREFKKLSHPEPDYGYLTNSGLWYICFKAKQTDDIPDVQKLCNLYREHKLFKAAYCLTVHE
jgi:hypothetical protein